MKEDFVEVIRENYDRLAAEYTAHISNELQHKPLDCELLRRFAEQTRDGEVCDLGCGPGHVARFLRQAHAKVFGLDLSPKMECHWLTGFARPTSARLSSLVCH